MDCKAGRSCRCGRCRSRCPDQAYLGRHWLARPDLGPDCWRLSHCHCLADPVLALDPGLALGPGLAPVGLAAAVGSAAPPGSHFGGPAESARATVVPLAAGLAAAAPAGRLVRPAA